MEMMQDLRGGMIQIEIRGKKLPLFLQNVPLENKVTY